MFIPAGFGFLVDEHGTMIKKPQVSAASSTIRFEPNYCYLLYFLFSFLESFLVSSLYFIFHVSLNGYKSCDHGLADTEIFSSVPCQMSIRGFNIFIALHILTSLY